MPTDQWPYLENETLGRGVDPDDLAHLVCRALQQAGVIPLVTLFIDEIGEEQFATKIEIRVRGLLVASFPIQPIKSEGNAAGLAHAISRIGRKS